MGKVSLIARFALRVGPQASLRRAVGAAIALVLATAMLLVLQGPALVVASAERAAGQDEVLGISVVAAAAPEPAIAEAEESAPYDATLLPIDSAPEAEAPEEDVPEVLGSAVEANLETEPAAAAPAAAPTVPLVPTPVPPVPTPAPIATTPPPVPVATDAPPAPVPTPVPVQAAAPAATAVVVPPVAVPTPVAAVEVPAPVTSTVRRTGPPAIVNQIPDSAFRWLDANGWSVQWLQGPGPGRVSEAQYATRTIVVWLTSNRSNTTWAGAFAHELGHAVSYEHFSPAQMSEWNAMRGLNSWRWVPGSANDFSVGEGDFAEAFMNYLIGHPIRSAGGPLNAEARAFIAQNTPF